MAGRADLTPESIVNGDISGNAGIEHTKLAQRTLTAIIPLHSWRTHDDLAVNLPSAGASDDLGYIEGTTFGTDSPTLQTSDAKATTVTQRARVVWPIPQDYIASATFQIRTSGLMKTTVSDGTATVDFEVHKHGRDLTVGSDICATAATTINSLTAADQTFTITDASLNPGDMLDIRMTVAITDAATGTAVIGVIAVVEVLYGAK